MESSFSDYDGSQQWRTEPHILKRVLVAVLAIGLGTVAYYVGEVPGFHNSPMGWMVDAAFGSLFMFMLFWAFQGTFVARGQKSPGPRTDGSVLGHSEDVAPNWSPSSRGNPGQVRRSAYRANRLTLVHLILYIVGGLGLLLIFQRGSLEHWFSDGTFINGLFIFIGWVGPLPFGIAGGLLISAFLENVSNAEWTLVVTIAGGFALWGLAAALSIWQAFW